jgi:hypothetical protein
MLAVEGDLEEARVLLRKAIDGGMAAAEDYTSTLDDDLAVRDAALANLVLQPHLPACCANDR